MSDLDVPRIPGQRGRRVSANHFSNIAEPLDPDQPLWERQDAETKKAYDAFVTFRDSHDRVVKNCGASASYWSRQWSWGVRANAWDTYAATLDNDEMIRYRRTMNDRQRRSARRLQDMVVKWAETYEPKTMTATEAARLIEVGVRIERLASGADTPQAQEVAAAADDLHFGNPASFAELVKDLHVDDESEFGEALWDVLQKKTIPAPSPIDDEITDVADVES